MIINGKTIARKIIEGLAKKKSPRKALIAVLVGGNAGSLSFLRQKEKIAQELGIKFRLRRFRESTSEKKLIDEIKKYNADRKVGGIILQLPLPPKLNRGQIIKAISPKKDVDALTEEGRKFVDSPSAAVVKEILRATRYVLRTKIVVVIGRGILVGKPIAEWLNGNPSAGSGLLCKKLIILHSKSNLADVKKGDLVITGVGKGGLITPKMLKPRCAGVIDFGYDFKDGKIVGDFNPLSYAVRHKLSADTWYTPTPGGTGPILVAELFRNFYKLNGIPDY